jgi:hypothetical protein
VSFPTKKNNTASIKTVNNANKQILPLGKKMKLILHYCINPLNSVHLPSNINDTEFSSQVQNCKKKITVTVFIKFKTLQPHGTTAFPTPKKNRNSTIVLKLLKPTQQNFSNPIVEE